MLCEKTIHIIVRGNGGTSGVQVLPLHAHVTSVTGNPVLSPCLRVLLRELGTGSRSGSAPSSQCLVAGCSPTVDIALTGELQIKPRRSAGIHVELCGVNSLVLKRGIPGCMPALREHTSSQDEPTAEGGTQTGQSRCEATQWAIATGETPAAEQFGMHPCEP